MPETFPAIRETRIEDLPAILALYPPAFPDEDLRPLVSELIEDDAVQTLSLATFDGDTPIAHGLFTLFDGNEGALLGPLCVHPDRQGKGLGTAIVRQGFARLQARGARQVFVLGDPAYYGRFGFRTEGQVLPPYPMPSEWADAWQSVLLAGLTPLPAGNCHLPAPWMKRALWLP